MSAMRWLQGLCVGLLAFGIGLSTTGCSDDDGDDSEGATIVVTNGVGGETIVVTNNPPAENNPPAGNNPPVGNNPPADDNPPADPSRLVAPDPVFPADGEVFIVVLQPGERYSVTFEWTGVAGAADYRLHVNNTQIDVAGTQRTLDLDRGSYSWSVYARDANGNEGPVSATFGFSIQSGPNVG